MYKDKQKIVVTIEARMTSKRLPGKVLLPLANIPALQMLTERVKRSRYVDDVVVATTINVQDEKVVKLCKEIDCKYFRGSEEDVLARVLGAAKSTNADIIVEITGDCPFIDHRHIDKTIEYFYSDDYDYAANVIERSFPVGFDVQVFPLKVLEKVDKLTNDPIDRVHVSCYIYAHPEKFKLFNWKAEGKMFWPELGITLDEKEDYRLLDEIAKLLLRRKKDFSAEDIVELLIRNKELVKINEKVIRKDLLEG
jgi:spore coat polysaccharide biosynthesis protein SpsF